MLGSARPLRPAARVGAESGRIRRIRILADRIGLESIDREGAVVVLKFRPDAKLDPAWLFRVVQQRGDVTLVPPATLKLDLKKPIGRKPLRRRPDVRRSGGKKGRIRLPAAPGGRRGPRPAR